MNLRDHQEEQLFTLLNQASETGFGKKYHFNELRTYEDFQREVPLSSYGDIAGQVEELKEGASNVSWPVTVNKFAVSAGTSGSGKHLPLSSERLNSDRRFMHKVAWHYLRKRPNIFSLWGTHISLPGTLEKTTGYEIGEISAFTAQMSPRLLSLFQLTDPNEFVHLPFDEKVERIIERSPGKDVRIITAAPSWLLTIFQRLLAKSSFDSIGEIWPNLKLLVCGGVKLANYQPHLERLLKKPDVDFIETYGASEGYFSFTDSMESDDMRLVIDNGIFYEFIPHPLPDKKSLVIQESIPLWEVESGTPYAMIVSTNAGLWRYALNDIVQFTQTNPPRIKVMGRVSEMLDDFGEALYAYEAEQALQEAAELLDLETGAFTIGSSLEHEQAIPRHFWFVQTHETTHPDTLHRLAQKLDSVLRTKNRHYAIRRESRALGMPTVKSINQQQINNWLEAKDRQQAQGKLPAILKNREDIDFFK